MHALIAPFAALGRALNDDELGMKLATVAFATFAVLCLYAVLNAAGAPWPWLLCFLPLCFGWIPWRMLQLRGGSVIAGGFKIESPLPVGTQEPVFSAQQHFAAFDHHR